MTFRVIIAGGRKFSPQEEHYLWIERMLSNKTDIEFVSGEALGADCMNWVMAQRTLEGYKGFPALWDRLDREPCSVKIARDGSEYNALAGFNRNESMAEYANALILFPGGNGSKDMLKRAFAHNLLIREWNGEN